MAYRFTSPSPVWGGVRGGGTLRPYEVALAAGSCCLDARLVVENSKAQSSTPTCNAEEWVPARARFALLAGMTRVVANPAVISEADRSEAETAVRDPFRKVSE
jgi:hypothetical protein